MKSSVCVLVLLLIASVHASFTAETAAADINSEGPAEVADIPVNEAVKGLDASIAHLQAKMEALRNSFQSQTQSTVQDMVIHIGRSANHDVKARVLRNALAAKRDAHIAQMAVLKRKLRSLSRTLGRKDASTHKLRLRAAREYAIRKQLALLDARKAAALRLARAKALARQEQKLREEQDAIEAAKAQRVLAHVQQAAALARMEAAEREKEVVRATRDQLTQVEATIEEGKINQEAAASALDLQAQIVRARMTRRAAEQIKKLEQDYLRADASPEQKDAIKRDIAAAAAVAAIKRKAFGAKLIAVEAEEHATAAAKAYAAAEQNAQIVQAEAESSVAAESEDEDEEDE